MHQNGGNSKITNYAMKYKMYLSLQHLRPIDRQKVEGA